ncbi:MAG: hypothetical protein ACK56I_33380, partial [bacterium]
MFKKQFLRRPLSRLFQTSQADVVSATFDEHRGEFHRHHCLQKGNIMCDLLFLQADGIRRNDD